MLKDMTFYHFQELQLIKTITRPCYLNRTRCFKIATEKAVEAIGRFVENKIVKKFAKSKLAPGANSKNVEKITIPPEQREEVLDK